MLAIPSPATRHIRGIASATAWALDRGHVNDRRPQLDRGQHHRGHAEGVEQGDHAEEHVLVLEAGVLDAGVHVALQIAEVEFDALGQAAGSAGVHQDGHVVGVFAAGEAGFRHRQQIRRRHGPAPAVVRSMIFSAIGRIFPPVAEW